jgi:hypothetical protein
VEYEGEKRHLEEVCICRRGVEYAGRGGFLLLKVWNFQEGVGRWGTLPEMWSMLEEVGHS